MAGSSEIDRFIRERSEIEERIEELVNFKNDVFNHQNYQLALVNKISKGVNVITNQDYSPPQEVWDLLLRTIDEKLVAVKKELSDLENMVTFGVRK